jgi:hypothetical protein
MNKLTPSEKKKLKERLRKLDKKLNRLYKYTGRKDTISAMLPDIAFELFKLDEKRKQVRNKLK